MAGMLELEMDLAVVAETSEDEVDERSRVERLEQDAKTLRRLLPKHVAKRLRNGRSMPAEYYSDVSILFTDIVGYTQMCSDLSPLLVMNLLNELYTVLDFCTAQFPTLYKVETIGDAYMVVCGAPSDDEHHAETLCRFALLIREATRVVLSPLDGQPIQLRLGINSGPVAAGTVGSLMPRYCFFGDAVNTAARMESLSEPVKIHLSQSTQRLLPPDLYDIVSRGEVEVKGKGLMHTYWLLGCTQLEIQKELRGIVRTLKKTLSTTNSESNSEAATPPTPMSGGGSTNDFRVLIVDDSSAQRKLVSHALNATDLGMDVRVADSAEMAMQMIRLSSYSMCFVDMNLSSDATLMDGCGLVELIRASPEGQGICLVGMSTSMPKYETAFILAGANATLAKPFPNTPELAEILKALRQQQDAVSLLAAALHGAISSSVDVSRQILIVEDSAMQIKLMTRRMQEVGALLSMRFDIMTVSSAEKAIDAFRFNSDPLTGKSRFHAALIDQQLSDGEGDMLGSDLIRALRCSAFCSSRTLLFGCSSSFHTNASTMLAAGGDHVFSKPLPTAAAMASSFKRFALFA